jgi:hypothetical protein
MFVLRSIFWLGTVVLLLPPAAGGEPAPRVNLLHTAYAARALVEDVSGVCDRNPAACAASREAMVLLSRKLQTGAGIVVAGLKAGNAPGEPPVDRGTLTTEDLEPVWSVADASY